MVTIEKEKALDVVRQMVADGQVSQEVAEKYFPELKESKESKDERIRKCIKYAIDKLFLKEKIVCDVHKDDVFAWLEKQGQVKDSAISQHENKTCKESDDSLTNEDIRNGLIRYFSSFSLHTFAGFDPKKILSWLEKQGEQKTLKEEKKHKFKTDEWIVYQEGLYKVVNIALKNYYELLKFNNEVLTRNIEEIDTNAHVPSIDEVIKMVNDQKFTDKAEPKFKHGQWIVWKDKCYKVNDDGCGYELVDQNGLITSLEYETVEESARVFAIQDAKDGDVLADNGAKIIFIFKNIEYDSHIESNVIKYFIRYSFDGINLPLENGGHLGVVGEYSNFVPATKEQRDTLIKAMADAGYTFDFEKKELKKIEQKSSWSEEDDAKLKSILFHIEDVENKDVIDWLKSLRPQSQWKPSEEQMYILNWVTNLLNDGIVEKHAKGILESLYQDLKKLREE